MIKSITKNWSSVAVGDSPLSDVSVGLLYARVVWLILIASLSSNHLLAQPVQFQLDSLCQRPNTPTVLPLYATDFSNVASFQTALRWDTSHVQLDTVVQLALPAVLTVNVIDTAGVVKLYWYADSGIGVTLTATDPLLELHFSPRSTTDLQTTIRTDTLSVVPRLWRYVDTVAQVTELQTLAGQLTYKTDFPELVLPMDTFLCPAMELNVQAVCTDCTTFQWTDGLPTAQRIITQTGNYALTAADSDGCVVTGQITVAAIEPPEAVIHAETTTPCRGDSILLIAGKGAQLSWQDSSSTLQLLDSTTAIVYPTTATRYGLVATNECQQRDTTSLLIEPLPTNVTAGRDTCIAAGTTAQLNARNAQTYRWLTAEYPVSDSTIANPTTQPADSAQYVLEAIDSNSCVIRDTVVVFVANNPLLAIESIDFISPNGDGKNDVLEFANIEKFNFPELTVFNRYGDWVYNRINYQRDAQRWDGTYRNTGQPLPTGVYFYVLEINGVAIRQTLNLVR